MDLLRGFAALTVLVCHYRWLFAEGLGDWRSDAPLPLYAVLWPIYEHGGLAVQLFWILSGFVFAVAYGQRDISVREFAIYRFARLYPLHFATLLAVTVLEFASLAIHDRLTIEPNFSLPYFVSHLFMASNWFTMEPSFNGPIWSVSIEVLIYLVFLVYIKRVGLSVPIALALAALGFAVEILTDSYVAMCLSLFFSGVVIAIGLPSARERLGERMLPFSILVMALVIVASFALDSIGRGNLVHTFLVYAGCPALLLVFIALDAGGQRLNPRWHWIGAITYAVYLLHMPTIITIKIFWPGVTDYLANPLSLAVYCVTIIALSIPVHRYFELPAQQRIRSLFKAKPEAAQVTART